MHFTFLSTASLLLSPALSLAQITGSVTLAGKPPVIPAIKQIETNPLCAQLHKDPVFDDSIVLGDNNELANVIVFIDPGKDKTLPAPKKQPAPAVLDQKGCLFSPHVLALQIGQPVLVKNSDPFLHNVHALCIDNDPFNVGQPGGAQPKELKAFTVKESFQIKCDIHPWMKVIVRVFDHPYFAVTDEKGKYSVDTTSLPDGPYTVKAWHEIYHESQPQQIQLKSGKPTTPINFTFKPNPPAPAAPEK